MSALQPRLEVVKVPPPRRKAELVHYDAMCRAIAEARRVDEVKDIRDKALALETYAAQARNIEAEAQACEIRLRAERRAGELLRDMQKSRGGRPPETGNAARPVSGERSLAELGISKPQSARWQKLADIPPDDFEASFGTGRKPSTAGVIAANAPQPERPPVDKRALWLWGRLLDFERNGMLDADPQALFENMLPHMQDSTRELLPRVLAWLKRMPR